MNTFLSKGIGILCAIFAVWSMIGCEQDDNPIGVSVLDDNTAGLGSFYINLFTSNTGADTIRSGRSVIDATYGKAVYSHATVGVFQEPVFGKTKSDFYTQVRLSQLNPDFGKNPTVDSVVLILPAYAFNRKDTLEKKNSLLKKTYRVKTEEGNCSVIDTTYFYHKSMKFALDSLYGDTQSEMTLQVHQVVENMGAVFDAQYSDKSYQVGTLFGEGKLKNKAYIQEIIRSSGEIDDKTAKKESAEILPTFHVQLDGMKEFINQNIINGNKGNLSDQISFVNNVLNGIRLSVLDDNGFIFTFNPNQMQIIVYYSRDNDKFKDENGNGVHDDEEDCPVVGTTARVSDTYSLIIGTVNNQPTGQFNAFQNYIQNTQSTVTAGDNQENIFITGMSGHQAILKLDKNKIKELRDAVKKNHWAINEARLKVYPDNNKQGNLPLPQYLYVYNHTTGKLLSDYGGTSTSEEITAIPYQLISVPYNKEKGYYMIRITDFLKNIVEKGADIDDLALQVGNYENPNRDYIFVPKNAYYSNRIYNPFRLVGFGGNPTSNSDKKLEIEVLYSKKETN